MASGVNCGGGSGFGLLVQDGGFTRLGRQPLAAKLEAGVDRHGRQHHVEDQQFAVQNAASPFFSGTSFLGTTPDRLSRTCTFFFLSLPPVT